MASTVIDDYSVEVDERWIEVPTGVGAGPEWADRFVASHGLRGTTARRLRRVLESRQRTVASLSEQRGGPVTALLWIPAPETAAVDAELSVTVIDLGVDGVRDPASFVAASAAGYPGPRGEVLVEFRSWSGTLEGGPFGACYEVVDVSGTRHESASFAVFPAGCAQYLFLFLDTDRPGVVGDLPARAQALAESVRLTVSQAS